MNPRSVAVQKSARRPEQLILLFHGMGATPEGLVPLGQRLASTFRNGTVVSVAAPHESDILAGYQWFSVAGITEANRVTRVAEAMPAFLSEIRAWQQELDVTATVTALVGFSQGAIMALESSVTPSSPAGRVIAIAGGAASRSRAQAHVGRGVAGGKNLFSAQMKLELGHRAMSAGLAQTTRRERGKQWSHWRNRRSTLGRNRSTARIATNPKTVQTGSPRRHHGAITRRAICPLPAYPK